MNFREYVESKKILYDAFAATVASNLGAALAARPGMPAHLLIKHRAKTEDSLRFKLEMRGLLDSENIETEIRDLAGCRVVFYTDGDKHEFFRSGVVFEEFLVDREETKVHFPVPGEPSEAVQYRATHFMVSLSDEKCALSDYARFAGLRCEIQVHTLLHHAWSEISHNITYKSALHPGFGRRKLEELKQHLDSIMIEHLVPAGHEFQKVKIDALSLKRGNEIISRDPISQLLNATDNNERVELLSAIKEYVIPYCDDIEPIYAQLRYALPKVIDAARKTTPKPIETNLGNFDGKTAYSVTAAAIDIVDSIRYRDIGGSLAIYCETFPEAHDVRERKRILDAVERLAAHTLEVWRQAGPYVQFVLLKDLAKLDANQRRILRPIIQCVCAEALKAEVSGTSSSYDTITLHRGSVKVSASLREVRSDALTLLEILYEESGTEDEKRQAFDNLLTATQHPVSASYEDDHIELTVQNAHRIVEFCLQRCKQMSFELLQHVEHRFCWLYQIVQSWAVRCDAGVQRQAEDLGGLIVTFRDAVNADVEFVRHKTLVGFDGVFTHDWDEASPDYPRTRAYRLAKIDEYIATVNNDTAEEWLRVIKRCVATRSRDGATFSAFFEFLTRFSIARPEIMLGYLADIHGDLEGFLHGILKGLELSPKADEANTLMERWVTERRYLYTIARHLRFAQATNVRLITSLARSAIGAKERIAVSEVAVIIVARPDLAGSVLVDEVFVPAIASLTEIKDTIWVDEAWYQPSIKAFFSKLTEMQAQAVLDNLVHRAEIDTHTEMILAAIAEVVYGAVWRFFGTRLSHKDRGTKDGYQPIPFKFHHAAPALGTDPNSAVDIVRGFYVDNKAMFEFNGGKLIAIAFPDCPDALQAKLITVIETDGVSSLPFVMGILRNYQGHVSIHRICQALINCLPEKDERLNSIDALLLSTGVIWGEFGMVDAYRKKRDEVASWHNDPRPKVRNYADRYVRALNLRIASEQSAAEEGLELRKLDWRSRAPK